MSYCKAPHTNMYFNVEGYCSPCWLSCGLHPRSRWSESRSIRDLWFNSDYKEWRNNEWPKFCSEKCKNFNGGHCQTGNLLTAYSKNAIRVYPTMMELELSNNCNLKCMMCNEMLSSKIRKEKGMPPLLNAYTDKFVEELEEFIPQLEELRFNGGEPLSHPIVYKILDKIVDLKPELKVTIATNGTIWSSRIEKYMSACNIHVNISIDGMSPITYERIRCGGKWDILMSNFLHFKRKARSVCIMVNPMTVNWREMVKFVTFTDTHRVNLAYNTVTSPKELSIMYSENIEEIWKEMKKQCDGYVNKHGQWCKFNQLVYDQIRVWAKK